MGTQQERKVREPLHEGLDKGPPERRPQQAFRQRRPAAKQENPMGGAPSGARNRQTAMGLGPTEQRESLPVERERPRLRCASKLEHSGSGDNFSREFLRADEPKAPGKPTSCLPLQEPGKGGQMKLDMMEPAPTKKGKWTL